MQKSNFKKIICSILTFSLIFLFIPLTALANSEKTYTIKPSTCPCDKKMTRFHTYNKNTKTYYTIRSYMEKLEKRGGGTLILAKGTYTITNTVYIPSNVTIKLSNGTIIKKGSHTGVTDMPASNSLFMLIEPSRSLKKNAVGEYKGAHNITFSGSGNAIIDMNNYKSSSDASIAVDCCHNRNIKISGITFRNLYNGHFIEMDATSKASITNCHFTNINGTELREAINIDTPDAVTQGFHAVWAKMDCFADRDVSIHNCKFANMFRGIGTHNYSGGHPHRNISVRDCTFTNISQYAVEMMYWQDSEVVNCTMTGSTVAANTYKATKKGAAVFAAGAINPQIYGNTIDSFAVAAYLVPWQGLEVSEKAAYAPIDCIYSDDNLNALRNNTCGPHVSKKSAICRKTFSDMRYVTIPMKTS